MTLAARLGIRPEEQRLVALLLAHSACLGIVRVSAETAANALFLQRYGAAFLPLSFLGAALLNPLLSIAYDRLGARLPFQRLLMLSLVVLLSGTLTCRALLQLPERWPVMLLLIFYQSIYLLTGLEFWGLCGRLFDVRQAKRLFGLIGSGELAAQIAMGLGIPLLLRVLSTQDLLLISAAGLAGCLFFLAAIRTIPGEADGSEERAPTLGRLLQDRYVVKLWGVTALYTACSYFIYQVFFDVAGQRYPDETQLAGFLGLYQACSGLLSLLAGGLATRWVLARFGLTVGLLCCPLGVLALGSGIALAPVFVSVVLLKLQDDTIFDTLYRPTFQTLRQPLPTELRAAALNFGEGLVEPCVGGLTGVVLLALTQWLHAGVQVQAALLAALALVWSLLCLALTRDYRRVLLQSLSRRSLDRSLHADSSSVRILLDALQSPHPGVIVYCLRQLHEDSPKVWATWLRAALPHPSAEIRRHVLEQIDEHRLDGVLPAVQERIESETDPEVRAVAVRTLATLGGGEVLEVVTSFLNHEQPLMRQSAVAGLLRSGELESILVGGEELTHWLRSADPEERGWAARALGEVGNAGLHRPMERLLQDGDAKVRGQALAAAARVRSPRLWPHVLDCLSHPGLRGLAVSALKAGGDSILPALDARYQESTESRVRLARIVSGIEAPAATRWLQARLEDEPREVRHQALRALSRRGYQAQGTVAQLVQRRLQCEASQALQLQAACQGCQGMVRDSLAYQLELRRGDLLLCLTLLYEPELLQRVCGNLLGRPSADVRAAALEMLEVVLPRPVKEMIFPVLEDSATALPAPTLAEIAGGPPELYSPWVRTCAAAQLKGDPAPMLTTLEKVVILKKISLFAETPDEVLAEAANALEEVEAPAGRTLFEVGDVGNRMYIVVHGQVRVHLGDQRLKTLGPGDFFGEMSLLDSEPRAASVTVEEDSRLLQLSQDVLYELMSDHSEVMRGIIRFLTANLRAHMIEDNLAAVRVGEPEGGPPPFAVHESS